MAGGHSLLGIGREKCWEKINFRVKVIALRETLAFKNQSEFFDPDSLSKDRKREIVRNTVEI